MTENKMEQYCKLPIPITAYQTDKEMDIETLEGTMHASVGDWIITGVNGEQYPCKPDIFAKTYIKYGQANKMAEIIVKQAYRKGREDFAKELWDELLLTVDYQDDLDWEFGLGVNYTMSSINEAIRKMAIDDDTLCREDKNAIQDLLTFKENYRRANK